MWTKTRRWIRVDRCPHEKRNTTTTAGLQRAACERCGHVTFSHVFDMLAEQDERIGAHSDRR